MEKRVTGLGGVFFKAKNPKTIKAWYKEHLHIDAGEHGAMFKWRTEADPEKKGITVWSPFPSETDYFEPGKKEFMFNYQVENLEELLKVLAEEGVEVLGEMQVFPYGKFAWIMDPEGNKIELWEPPLEDEQ